MFSEVTSYIRENWYLTRVSVDEKSVQYVLIKEYDLKGGYSYILTKKHSRKGRGVTKYWINPDTYLMHRYETISQFSKSIIEYKNIDINKSLTDKQFSFTPSLSAMEEITKILHELPISGITENLIILNNICIANIPDFYEDTQNGYRVWRSINDDKIKAINEDVVERATNMILAIEKKPKAKELVQICRLPRATFEAHDKRRNEFLTTPEETWEYFKTSLKNADRVGALACLAGSVKEKFRDFLKKAAVSKLATLSDSVGGYRKTLEMGGDKIEGVIITKHNKVGTIQFQKMNGAWKITDM